MSVINQDVKRQVAHYLDKINTKRRSQLVITNDQRASALGMYFDVNGVLRTSKQHKIDQKSGAVRTSWPVNGMK